MPPIQKKITPEKQRIDKTIKTLKNDEYISVVKTHCVFNVLYQKLLQYYNSRSAANSLSRHNKTFDDAQKQVLLQYINCCSKLKQSFKHKHIELTVNSILQVSDSLNTVFQV